MASSLVFRGMSVLIASVETHRRYKVVPWLLATDAVDFAPGNHIPIDLDESPSKQTDWTKVSVDDRGIDAKGDPLGSAMCMQALKGYHVTSLGGVSDDLPRGCFAGVVYIEDGRFKPIRAKVKWPPGTLKSYQLTTVHYSADSSNGPRAGKRYAGFHGTIRGANGTFALVEISRLPAAAAGPFWFDLSSGIDTDYDPPLEAGDKLLKVSSPRDSDGAIFIELTRVASLGLSNPKLPIGLGG